MRLALVSRMSAGVSAVASGFILGLAQMFSFGLGTVEPDKSKAPARTDAEALRGDWMKVSGDMWTAIDGEQRRS